MKKKQTYGIILVVIGLAIVGALHQFVFAQIKADWTNYEQELNQLSSRYKTIVTTVKKEEESGVTTPRDRLPTKMTEIIQSIQDKIESDKENFQVLDSKLKLIEHFDPSANYRDQILTRIDEIQRLENTTKVTELNVSSAWGVNHGIRSGRFSKGFYASNGRSIAYSNILDGRSVINPRKGTIEFWVKPEWDPTDTDIQHKCLFMGITIQRLGRDRLVQMAEEVSTEQNPLNINSILPPGPGPFPVENIIAIYKGQGATLTFELRNFIQPPSTVTAYISDWKPDQWYYVSAIWEAKRQALYINGQNKGVPFGSGGSIRDARDEEDSLFFGGGMMGGMGGMMGGMGGMMGGMGGMMGGMGGFGMGGMMGGMGGMMGGFGGGGQRFGTSAGQTLTTNISLPSIITSVFVGADEENSFAADCTFDDLRIQDGVYISGTPNGELQKNSATLLIDHFEEDMPDPSILPALLTKLDERQKAKHLPGLKEYIRERYSQTYDWTKHAIGLNEAYLTENNPTMKAMRELYVMEYIRDHVTGYSIPMLQGLLEIDPKNHGKEDYHRIVEFQKLCQDLAQQAVDDRLISINDVIYKGQSYNVDDDELRGFFRQEREELRMELFGDDNIYLRANLTSAGGYGMGMMGGGMMGGGMMGGGMMGGFGYGMGGMMGGGVSIDMFKRPDGSMNVAMLNKMEIFDPDDPSGEALLTTIDQKIALLERIEKMKEDFKLYMKYHRDELIPPQIIDEFNKTMEETNQDYYIKRSLTLDLDSGYNQVMNYFYNLEFGPRINTINNLIMTKMQENDAINAVLDVESHFLEKLQEDQTDSTSPSTSAIGMN